MTTSRKDAGERLARSLAMSLTLWIGAVVTLSLLVYLFLALLEPERFD